MILEEAIFGFCIPFAAALVLALRTVPSEPAR